MVALAIFCAALLFSWLANRLMSPFAKAAGLLDHPGGRKDHSVSTPLVGGIGIFLVLAGGLALLRPAFAMVLGGSAAIVTMVGVLDDRFDVHPIPKVAAQAVAGLLLFYAGNIQLHSIGNLLGFGPVGMWVFALPVTLVAVVGVVNSINMTDGIDGHAGSITLSAFVAYALVARGSGLWDQYQILLLLAGANAGFLLLNMRLPWQGRAQVFLGDSGSLLLGLCIAWFAIDLTQGDGRSFPPICALWVIVVPLCDCVSLMLRRLRAGTSPFAADRQHLHHYLLARGCSVSAAHALSAVANVSCAAIGYAAWKYSLPEPVLFAAFVALFLGYHFVMKRAFRDRDVMTTGMGPSAT